MSTRLTRRGRVVVASTIVAGAFAFGLTSGDVCYWGRCSDRAVAVTAPEVTAAERQAVSDIYGPIALVTEPDPAPVQGPRPSARSKKLAAIGCADPLAILLYNAGWRGDQLRIAYAVVWRESNGRPDAVGDGGYGLFQLQKSAHQSKWWWDDELLMDDTYNAMAAFDLWSSNGWRPWGLTADGTLDPRDYPSWSDWQIQNWIAAPFYKYLNQFDTVCGGSNDVL